MIDKVLLIVAFILFVLAAIGWPKTALSLGWAGAALCVLTLLI